MKNTNCGRCYRSDRIFLLIIMTLALTFSGAFSSYAITINVPGNYPTITQALEAATSGDDIVVAAGTYAATTNGETYPLQMKAGVDLFGAGSGVTILDAQGTTSNIKQVIQAAYVNSVTISGFTITGGFNEGAFPFSAGGGIYVNESSGIVIQNNMITDNYGEVMGGGIYANLSDVIISNNVISNNTSASGGGIHLEYSNLSQVVDNVIYGNIATVLGGGGVTSIYTSIQMNNNKFIANYALGGSGGGLRSLFRSGTDLININHNFIYDNYSTAQGGGIYFYSNDTLQDSVSNNLVWNNTTYYTGAGVYLNRGNTKLRNNTIVDNIAPFPFAGGLQVNQVCYPVIYDSILWNNGDDLLLNVSIPATTVGYCDIEDGDYSGSNGNIFSNPLFAVGPKGGRYLSQIASGQASNSPCYNSGSASASSLGMNIYTTRTDGVADSSTVDRGYHYDLGASDNTGPIITILDPAEGSPQSGSFTVNIDAQDYSGIASVEASINGVVWQAASWLGSYYRAVLNSTLEPDGYRSILCRAHDNSAYSNIGYGSSVVIIDNYTPPYTVDNLPDINQTNVSLNATISFEVRDGGYGVDDSSIELKIENILVSPSISSTYTGYLVNYDPPSDFCLGQVVDVEIIAADLAPTHNLLDQTYTFTTTGVDTIPPTFNGVLYGMTTCNPGEVALFWDPATDSCNDYPITYNVYMSEEESTVFWGNPVLSVDETTFAVVPGLPDGVAYYFGVRAEDDSVYQNEDANTVTVQVTPSVPIGFNALLLFVLLPIVYITTRKFLAN